MHGRVYLGNGESTDRRIWRSWISELVIEFGHSSTVVTCPSYGVNYNDGFQVSY